VRALHQALQIRRQRGVIQAVHSAILPHTLQESARGAGIVRPL
jgi:hypothetical protein